MSIPCLPLHQVFQTSVAAFKMDVEEESRKKKQSNAVQTWGNATTMNINNMIHTNILSSPYFKNNLFTLKTYHEVVDEIYYQVTHLEPWEKGSRKTSGQVGMCGGVRGVGAGGIVSSCYCLLFKLFTLKLTKKQLQGLIDHCDSPYIRGIGFMYIRYCLQPKELWFWLEPYLEDEEEIDVKAGGGCTMTVGQLVRSFLLKLEWYGTLFPRIPVPVEKDIRERLTYLNLCDDHKRKADEGWGEAERYAQTKREEDGEPKREQTDFGEAEKYSRMHRRSRSRDRPGRDERAREPRQRRSGSAERLRRRSRSQDRPARRKSPRRRSRSAERVHRRRSRSAERLKRRDGRTSSREKVQNRHRRSRNRERSRSREAASKERQLKHGSRIRAHGKSSRSRSREKNRRSVSGDRKDRRRDRRSDSKERMRRSHSNEVSRERRSKRSPSEEKHNKEEKIRKDREEVQNGEYVGDERGSPARHESPENANRKSKRKRSGDRSLGIKKEDRETKDPASHVVDDQPRLEDDSLEAGELRGGSEDDSENHRRSKSKHKKKKSKHKESEEEDQEEGNVDRKKHKHKKTKKKHK